MKLKINKATDLSSISVLPPHARRSNTGNAGSESLVFGKIQASQLRSQPSQQSFSQGVSSQHGMFSQLSQNSLEETVTNDQVKRLGSQERENSGKKISCLPPINYSREESQMPISRSSSTLMRKWNSASIQDPRYQISEELEHRIGMMETSLNKFGRILDSVQSDIMQVNKGTKEVSLEVEGIRQKLIVQDNSLQLMNKGQEDTKTSLEGRLSCISDQLSQDIHRERLQEISSVLSALPEKLDVRFHKLKFDLCKTFSQEMQAIACSFKIPIQKPPTPIALPSKGMSNRVNPQHMPPLKNPVMHPKVRGQSTLVPKVEVGSWTSVKLEQSTSTYRASNNAHKQKRVSLNKQERDSRVVIESDEEMDRVFSCLLKEKETDMRNYSMADAKEETQRILRKARRSKRKYHNPIILD